MVSESIAMMDAPANTTRPVRYIRRRPKIVLLGMMTRIPVAGVVWQTVHYLLGLERLGYDAGIIGDNVFRVRPVSVTTYDSACIHTERFGNQFGLVVFDEAHKLSAHFFGQELKRTKRFLLAEALGAQTRHLLFMTAIPWVS